MTITTVSSGVTSTGLAITGGNELAVLSGGTASGTLVSNGGTEYVFSGGTANGTTVSSGGKAYVSGGTVNFATVSNGAQNIFAGGTASATSVNAGGGQFVFSGGKAIGTTLTGSGAIEEIFSGGTATGATVNSGGGEFVFSGGTAIGAKVSSGGKESIFAGGTASGTTVISGAEDVFSGTASGTILSAGGNEYVYSGGTAISTTLIGDGAAEDIFFSGTASGTTVSSGGQQFVFSGGTAVGAAVSSGGRESILLGGTAAFTTVNFGGIVTVSSGGAASGSTINGGGGEYVASGGVIAGLTTDGGTLVLNGPAGTGGIDFSSGGRIVINGTAPPTNVISGFAPGGGEIIDLTALTGPATGSANLGANNVLTITEGAQSFTLNLDPAQSFAGEFFHLATDGAGGTDLTVNDSPCYLAGTRIMTAQGEVAVEALAIGDLVRTRDGACKPIKWIGQRSYAGLFTAINPNIRPVLIRAGALGEGAPQRDLYVSPEHAVLLRGALIPAKLLVNGKTIVLAEGVDPIRYFHIELEAHEIIFAEGQAAESFVDCGSRLMFQNAPDFAALYPNDDRPGWTFCAPRVEAGFLLELVRRDLAGIAGIAAPEHHQGGGLQGNLDTVSHHHVAGWAYQPEHPAAPVYLEILDGDALLLRVWANQPRADVARAGFGDGNSGFDITLPVPLNPNIGHTIHVRRAADQAPLQGAPRILPCAAGSASLADAVAHSLAAAAQPRDLDALLAELGQAAARLRASRARMLEAAPRHAGKRGSAPRALVIDNFLPNPATDAGSCAMISHMAALQRLGFEVAFVASNTLEASGGQAAALQARGITVHGAPAADSVEAVLRQGDGYDLIYLHRLANAEAYAALARRHNPAARLLYAVADLLWLRAAREALVLREPARAQQSAALRERELLAMRLVDAVLTHSPVEAGLLRQAAPGAKVFVTPWDVPVSDTVAAFRPEAIGFLGNYNHAPNLDAADWLIREIMPLVWAQNPAIRCVLAGSAMPQGLADWAAQESRISVLGHVETLAELFGQVRLTVAPLRYGAGIKGKVLDSFAAGVPCVMSGIAAEGMNLPPALRSLVGEDAPAIAALILHLHGDAQASQAAAQAGRAMLRARFSPGEVDAALRAAIGQRQGAAAIASPRRS